MEERVLVLGGTGLLGKAAVRALRTAGYAVRVMTRNLENSRPSFADTVELVVGDVTDVEALRRAMSGCFGIHISVGGAVDRLSAENVCGLAKETGIARLGYISGATVCEENRWFPMVAQKLDAEKAVRECGIPFTIFCPTWPMEMLERFARGGQPVLMGAQRYPIHWYAVDDLGRMAAAAYRNDAAVNKRFYVHGPEGIPMREALERYCARLYPNAKAVSIMPVWLAKTIAALSRNTMMRYGARLMGYFDKVGEMGDPSEANALLGAPSTRFDEWIAAAAAQHAAK